MYILVPGSARLDAFAFAFQTLRLRFGEFASRNAAFRLHDAYIHIHNGIVFCYAFQLRFGVGLAFVFGACVVLRVELCFQCGFRARFGPTFLSSAFAFASHAGAKFVFSTGRAASTGMYVMSCHVT